MPKCFEFLPCDWLISNLCYQAIEQVYLIKWPVSECDTAAPGSSWGFGALLKGLTSVVDNSCRSRDSNPQPRVTSPTLYLLGHDCPYLFICGQPKAHLCNNHAV